MVQRAPGTCRSGTVRLAAGATSALALVSRGPCNTAQQPMPAHVCHDDQTAHILPCPLVSAVPWEQSAPRPAGLPRHDC